MILVVLNPCECSVFANHYFVRFFNHKSTFDLRKSTKKAATRRPRLEVPPIKRIILLESKVLF